MLKKALAFMRVLFFILIMYFIQAGTSMLFAQSDTSFWFVAPECSRGLGSATNRDRPIYLRITSYDDDAIVKVTQPANPAFSPFNISVPANNTSSINLSSQIAMVENTPANTILNYGLHIQSDYPVSVYYEQQSQNNPDIFTLKGRNALGTYFLTPFQDDFNNNDKDYNPYPKSSFDIVATQNNTQVTITARNDIVGHSGGIPFTITLNTGQTYSAEAASRLSSDHPWGSIIESTKPIAITVKDDSVDPLGNDNTDLMGDQIVPVDLLGTQYIVVRGALNTPPSDRVYVLATEDNTNVYIDGNALPADQINKGETYGYLLSNASTYIQTNHPVYVWHMSGFTEQVGGALLPVINCNGSSRVSFVRTNSYDIFVMIFTESGHESDFLVNGNTGIINASQFSAVPGTSNGWMAAKINLSGSLSVGTSSTIENTSGLFHMGFTNGNTSAGCRYGFFSDFSTLFIGPDQIICAYDSIQLDAGPDKESYLWNTGATTQSIWAKDAGTYWVDVSLSGCSLSDTIIISKYPDQGFELGADTTICFGDTLILYPGSYASYLWQDGSTDSIFKVFEEGFYRLEVADTNGCLYEGSRYVSLFPRPEVDLGLDTGIIIGDTITLYAGAGFSSYLWSDGSTADSLLVWADGSYSVTVTNADGCTASDQVLVYTYDPCIQGTSGNDFWFAFMDNRFYRPNHATSITISSKYNASGQLYIGDYTTPYIDFSVPHHSAITLTIDYREVEPMSSQEVVSKAIHLVSDLPVSVYTLNYENLSSDAALIFPTQTLGTDYYAMCYTPAPTNYSYQTGVLPIGKNSEFVVAAIHDQTTVLITPSVDTDKGNEAGIVFDVELNQGDIYQVQSMNFIDSPEGEGDLTGSHIQSDKPIAVYSGNLATQVPHGINAKDHLYEQMIPLSKWGRNYYTIPLKTRDYDVFRVLAGYNNTKIYINDVLTATLDASEFYEFNTQGNNNPVHVHSNKLISLAHFSCGKNIGATLADPFMVMLNPVNQMVDSTNFVAFESSVITNYYVNILTRIDDKDKIYFDDAPLLAEFTDIPNSEYAYVQKTIVEGVHSLNTSEVGHGYSAYVYGYGDLESYGYMVGVNLNTTLDLGGDTGDSLWSCEGHPTLLDAGADFESYLWSTGATTREISVMDTGYYWVDVVNDVGCELTDSLKVLHIASPEVQIESDTGICFGDTIRLHADTGFFSYEWNTGSTSDSISIWENGQYWVEVTDTSACTGSDTMFLTVYALPQPLLGSDTSFCSVDSLLLCPEGRYISYRWNDGRQDSCIYAHLGGTYIIEVSDTNTCIGTDTIEVVMYLNAEPDITGSAEVCQGWGPYIYTTTEHSGNTYVWSTFHGSIIGGQGTYEAQIDWITALSDWVILIENTINNCPGRDSIEVIIRPKPGNILIHHD